MTSNHIKSEIRKTLNDVPDQSLQSILDFIKELQDNPADKVKPGKNLWAIALENQALLERLVK